MLTIREAQMETFKGAAIRTGGSDTHNYMTPSPVPPHGPGVVIDGSATVLINNMPACRMGDSLLEAIGPPNKIAKGDATVLIGGEQSALPSEAGCCRESWQCVFEGLRRSALEADAATLTAANANGATDHGRDRIPHPERFAGRG